MSKIETAIVLAGGQGTRLQPFTFYTSKHLLPVGDVPMIYYPLKNLALLGVKRIFLIINPNHHEQWKNLILNTNFGMEITLITQAKADGIPDAIKCCRNLICNETFYVALGDNIIIASNFLNNFEKGIIADGATICGFRVRDPKAFGVAKYNKRNELIEVIEKPKDPPSNVAIAGLYAFPADVFEKIDKLTFSNRGELEVAELINMYISEQRCAIVHSNSAADYWLDTGSHEALFSCNNFIRGLTDSMKDKLAHF